MPYLGKESGFSRSELAQHIKNMRAFFADYTYAKDKAGSELHPVDSVRKTLAKLTNIAQLTAQMYKTDGDRESVITAGMKEYLKGLYEEAFKEIEDLKKCYDDPSKKYDDNEEAKNSIEYFFSNKLLEGLQSDYDDIAKNIVRLDDDIIDEGMAILLNTAVNHGAPVLDAGGPQFVGSEEHLSTYLRQGIHTIVPDEIQTTGDPREIIDFYMQNANDLKDFEMDYLRNRVENIFYIRDVEIDKQNKPKKLTRIEEAGDNILMPDIKLGGKQDTNNGCWSCGYQMLLQSRGVFLDQMHVRSFRPGIGTKVLSGVSYSAKVGMLNDKPNSIMEFGDLALKTMPNAALRNVSLTLPSNRKTPENIADFEKHFTDTVSEALRKYKSPVAVTNGVHFMTIVGMQDGAFMVKDSQDINPNITNILSAEQFFELADGALALTQGIGPNLELTFVQDLDVTPEKNCTSFENDVFKGAITYKDGILQEKGYQQIDTNVMGETFGGAIETNTDVDVVVQLYAPRVLAAPQPILQQEGKPVITRPLGAKNVYEGPDNTIISDRRPPVIPKGGMDLGDGFYYDPKAFGEDVIPNYNPKAFGETKTPQVDDDGFPVYNPKDFEDTKPAAKQTPVSKPARNTFEYRLATDADYRDYVEEIIGEVIPAAPRDLPEPFEAEPVFRQLSGFRGAWASIKKFFTRGKVDDFKTHQENFDKRYAKWLSDKEQYEEEFGTPESVEAENRKYHDYIGKIKDFGLDKVDDNTVKSYFKEKSNAQVRRNIEILLADDIAKNSPEAVAAKQFFNENKELISTYLKDHPDMKNIVEAAFNNEKKEHQPEKNQGEPAKTEDKEKVLQNNEEPENEFTLFK